MRCSRSSRPAAPASAGSASPDAIPSRTDFMTFRDPAGAVRRAGAHRRWPTGGPVERTGSLEAVTDASASPVVPEVVEGPPAGLAPGADGSEPSTEDSAELVRRPTKLIRIASMVRGMLEEVRRAPLDDAGRRALREIHEKSLRELEGVLSPELQKELEDVVLPFNSDTPSESELRIAQAQLVGWLEGLFHGIQATLFTQQALAQQQLSEIGARRAIEPGAPGERAPGAYL